MLKKNPIERSLWIALAIASFSISGFPLLSGFGAKVLTTKNLVPWQVIGMNLAALGTAISFAKFIFLPHANGSEKSSESGEENIKRPQLSSGFWLAMVILLGGLVMANGFYYEAYKLSNIVKPLATIAAGWLAYFLIFQKLKINVPRTAEKFEHLIGGMSLMLTLLFWMVMA